MKKGNEWALSVDETPRCLEISKLRGQTLGARRPRYAPCYKGEFVLESILSLIAAVRVFFCSRSDTALEVLALRQQVAVLKRKRPRPTLSCLDRLFWTTLRCFW